MDPNLLLNTTALSTAALVAIIGALLVSRVIALNSDRAALSRREAELGAQIEWLGEQIERIRTDVLRRDAVDFIHAAADDIVASRGRADLDTLVERYDPRERSPDELRPFVDEAKAAVAAAFARSDPSELLRTSTDRYALLYTRVSEALKAQGGGAVSAASARPAGFTIKQEEAYRQLLRDEQSLVSERRSLMLQRGQVQAAIDASRNPPGVRSGAAVLLFFAFVGDVVPLVVMGTGPTRLTTRLAVIIIGLFLLGLAAFAAYLFVEIRRLTPN